MLNHITLMGRMVKNPELRFTPQNTPVASFTLAVERDYQPGGSERQTDFIDCVAWRKTAEFVSKHFQKGSLAAVSGRLQIRDWTDRDGGKRRSAEVAVDNVYFAEKSSPSPPQAWTQVLPPLMSSPPMRAANCRFEVNHG